jgi:hypothetical protein
MSMKQYTTAVISFANKVSLILDLPLINLYDLTVDKDVHPSLIMHARYYPLQSWPSTSMQPTSCQCCLSQISPIDAPDHRSCSDMVHSQFADQLELELELTLRGYILSLHVHNAALGCRLPAQGSLLVPQPDAFCR